MNRTKSGLKLVLVMAASLMLSACNLSGGGAAGYRWYGVGQTLGFVTGLGFALDGTLYATDQVLGAIRFDAATSQWRSVDTPGSFNAQYVVGADGAEYVTDYGIYTRPAGGAATWTVLPDSRAKQLEFLMADRDGAVYARTARGVVPHQIYVRVKGATASWTPISDQPSGYDSYSVISPEYTARLHIKYSESKLVRLEGATAITLPQPTGTTFDFAGNRYVISQTAVSRVTPNGTLEPWITFVQSGPLRQVLGFGKDGRYYAVAGLNNTSAIYNYTDYDIIALAPNDTAWKLVASSRSNGDNSVGGPALNLDNYSSGFSPDGSLIVAGCESGCSGGGNLFTYGVYRLKF